MNDLTFASNGCGGLTSEGFDGTKYFVTPWGGAYRAGIETSEGLSYLGNPEWLAEAKRSCQEHSNGQPFAIDEWTGRRVPAEAKA